MAVAAATSFAAAPTLTRATASGRRLSSPPSRGRSASLPHLPPKRRSDRLFSSGALCFTFLTFGVTRRKFSVPAIFIFLLPWIVYHYLYGRNEITRTEFSSAAWDFECDVSVVLLELEMSLNGQKGFGGLTKLSLWPYFCLGLILIRIIEALVFRRILILLISCRFGCVKNGALAIGFPELPNIDIRIFCGNSDIISTVRSVCKLTL